VRVLLLGGGGREHALAWKLRQSSEVDELFYSPGADPAPANAGLASVAEWVPLDILDPGEVAKWSEARRVDLVVVGPEAPLVAGVAGELRRRGMTVFGPSMPGALLEGSKVFAKEFMTRHGIPTARFEIFREAEAARRHLASRCTEYPLVVKADGLASGKGVSICETLEEALEALDRFMVRRVFGVAGERVIVEERLLGREASFFVVTDGRRAVPLETCQDYKRLEDGDRGPNTGGMGGFSPSPFLDAAGREAVMSRIVEPTLAGLSSDGISYRGVLYVGLMLTSSGPKVLEFNARFGDPETQALMPRLASDLLPLLLSSARGELDGVPLRWRDEPSVCVVLASRGYPGAFDSGWSIAGVDRAETREGVAVFHAGTRRSAGGTLVTAGGRVLAVVALGGNLEMARRIAYEAAAEIRFEGRRHRTDIAEIARTA